MDSFSINANTAPPICPIDFRPFQPADLQEVFDLHILAAKEVGAYPGSKWDYDFQDIEGNYGKEFFVAECESQIIAMGALRKMPDGAAEIRRVRVHPDYQRRGIGQAILDMLESRACALGYTVLRLDTTVQQLAAQALYRKNGFVEIGRNQIEGWDLIIFEKQIGRNVYKR